MARSPTVSMAWAAAATGQAKAQSRATLTQGESRLIGREVKGCQCTAVIFEGCALPSGLCPDICTGTQPPSFPYVESKLRALDVVKIPFPVQ
jgi:hypothetical protein